MKRIFAAAIFLLSSVIPSAAGAASRAYAATAAQGGAAFTIEAGHAQHITLKFRNTGSSTWKNTGKAYVSLYASGPSGRKSLFRDASWPGAGQAARLDQASVKPGQSGSVTFSLHAPSAPGTYRERFQLASEDTAWIYGGTADISITVTPERITAATPVNAKAYVVTDAETGELLASQDPDEVRSIASMTKLMTVMVAREAGLDQEQVVALARDDEVGGGRLRVRDGVTLSVDDLVASAIIGSANNAAHALARVSGLSKEDFVARMDAKAQALGLPHTSFADPTGIEVANVSTAREMASLAKAAFDDPWVAKFAGMPTYTVQTSDGPHQIKNTNKLMHDGAIDVVAGKTGFIYEAGYTLATRLRREGKHDLIVVVMGCDASAQPFRDAKVLAEKAWAGGQIALAK